jgi:hypothetical protein
VPGARAWARIAGHKKKPRDHDGRGVSRSDVVNGQRQQSDRQD